MLYSGHCICTDFTNDSSRIGHQSDQLIVVNQTFYEIAFTSCYNKQQECGPWILDDM